MNRNSWSRRLVGSALLVIPLASAAIADGFAPAVFAWGYDSGWCETCVPQITGPVIDIAAGVYHSMALGADGTVHGWGYLAIPKGLGTVTAIAAGAYHSVALLSNGTVRCWGADDYGQSTVPAQAVSVVRIAAGRRHTLAASASGGVLAWGLNDGGQSTVPAGLGSTIALSGGESHSMGLRVDGTVVCWGSNDLGQCSVPSDLGIVTAIAAGDRHSVALRANGTVACWGANDLGQCDVPPGLDAVTTIAAGLGRTAVLRSGNIVSCDERFRSWGNNSLGQLDFHGPFHLTDVALGDGFAIGLSFGVHAESPIASRRRTCRLLSVTGMASFGYPDYVSTGLAAISASGAGLPDGRSGRLDCNWDEWSGLGSCAMAAVDVFGETFRLRQGIEWEYCEYCRDVCEYCGDLYPQCPWGQSQLETWVAVERPHRIIVDRVDVVGVDNCEDDQFGHLHCSYCPVSNATVRVEAFGLSSSDAVGPPRLGPWGTHSIDLAPGQQLLIDGPMQGAGALSGLALRITVPSVFSGYFGDARGAFVDLRISRAWPAADIIPDGIVDAQDLGAVIAEWGQDCFGRAASDTNLDGRIDGHDLGAVLFAWGTPG